MTTYKIRFYVRSLQHVVEVQANTVEAAKKIVREDNPRLTGFASVEVVE